LTSTLVDFGSICGIWIALRWLIFGTADLPEMARERERDRERERWLIYGVNQLDCYFMTLTFCHPWGLTVTS
jgi:hypothetical protein